MVPWPRRATFGVLRFTFGVSRLAFGALRLALRVARFTFGVSRFGFRIVLLWAVPDTALLISRPRHAQAGAILLFTGLRMRA